MGAGTAGGHTHPRKHAHIVCTAAALWPPCGRPTRSNRETLVPGRQCRRDALDPGRLLKVFKSS